MGRQTQSISMEELTDISQQCAALHNDWQRFYQIAAAPTPPDDNNRQLVFIQLQSRLSCDYPILTHWRKGNFGLASAIGKLVAQAGTLDAFAIEARAGEGPLVREWHTVNEAIARVRKLLDQCRQQAKAGKPVTLPKEIAAPRVREPWPVAALARKAGTVCAVLAGCLVLFLLFRPLILETSLFKWLDSAYTAWQIRNGIPGLDGIPIAPD